MNKLKSLSLFLGKFTVDGSFRGLKRQIKRRKLHRNGFVTPSVPFAERQFVMKRILALALLLGLLFGCFAACFFLKAGAAEITEIRKSYDIAVVYDNSGSMYDDESWCRAKYALEIFASMLDYETDHLHVFPMWEVVTDGSQPSSGGSHEAFEIKSKNDIDKISNMYTTHPSNTPFEPIDEAHAYLRSSTAEEKWLIVLTDGAFNEDARGERAPIDLQDRLSSLASAQIKVQYLGFGKATELTADESRHFYARRSSASTLKDDLIEICNRIFQRLELPSNRLNGTTLNLDLSMRNVIVFVQGQNAEITSLKNADGGAVPVTMDSGRRKYSEIGANGYPRAPMDTSLAGQVVTFGACAKGTYTLSYTNADRIQIFYEPDVDIEVTITNSDGQAVTGPDDFIAGEYTVSSRIVDSATGEDVTKHELMGNEVALHTTVRTSSDTDGSVYENGAKITFEPDEETEIEIEGTYLGKFTISSKQDADFSWLSGIKIQAPLESLQMRVATPQSLYQISGYAQWEPIEASLTLDGQPLTDEQLAAVRLNLLSSEDLVCRCEPVPGKSAFRIFAAQDENGNFVEPDLGEHTLQITATYTDSYGREIVSSGDASITFQRHSLDISVSVLQSQSWYKLSNHDEWKPIQVSLLLDGQPLTDEQLADVTLDVELSDELPYRTEPVAGKSAYAIYIAQDGDGNYIEPETGKYELKVSAGFLDEYGKETRSGDAQESFEIQKYSKVWRYLFWILLLLAVFVLWLLFMLQKVMPKKIIKQNAEFYSVASQHLGSENVSVRYNRKRRTLSVNGPNAVDVDEQCSATFTLRPLDNRFIKSARRRVALVKISSTCELIEFAGVEYEKRSGQWVKSTVEDGGHYVINQRVSGNIEVKLSRENGTGAEVICQTIRR